MTLHSESALLTDFYELTMLQAYFAQQMNDTAVFEFFVRRLPERRNFLMAAGLEQIVSYLTDLHFTEDDITWLRESGRFSAPFLESLRDFRFTGDVDAMPEGTILFQDEPILRISAPMREAQFVESRVMNMLQLETMIASKAVRCVMVANGKRLVDFGLRRAHGAEAGLLSARASYVAGFDATATTLAGALFRIPVSGTMAHSYVQAHDSETEAFAAFARAFPDNATLLIDTYDTEAAALQVTRLAQWLQEEEGIRIKAVRLDSGDLGTLAYRVREILDAEDCRAIEIFASGNLDEYAVQTLVEGDAPIDGFGIGTRMNTSADAPFLDCAYKLVEYAGQACRKRSLGKVNWPGRKQVFRHYDAHGLMQGDLLALPDEDVGGEALLRPVMRGGTLLQALPTLADIRSHAREQLARLPPSLYSLEPAPKFPLEVSLGLQALTREVDERQRHLADSDRQRWGAEAG
ncbi:MAG TPA: nicotinate phosphoribosyltransferase [Noviherbaspirillum sp.]|uniref:nicotinate phosphoribosyltransferase n=1 Tax=Noviherbaspirillum sp. TaxID=1926288 RepID=UPI002B45CF1D|nr:nicotinate phosphoribosyltransferase [Noviherbaspirillum sp.]HJV84374.1 nicotinate phosphoribosyltransferase [Noviherbaspirillum sp.]